MKWTEKVIGTNRIADPDKKAGRHGFFELRTKQGDLTVVANVYPFIGVTGPDGPHAWGVRFPEQGRKTTFDTKSGQTIETRPFKPERKFGSHADSREAAMEQAEQCIRQGGWDGLDRNDNGTLKTTAEVRVENDALTAATLDDVPEGF